MLFFVCDVLSYIVSCVLFGFAMRSTFSAVIARRSCYAAPRQIDHFSAPGLSEVHCTESTRAQVANTP